MLEWSAVDAFLTDTHRSYTAALRSVAESLMAQPAPVSDDDARSAARPIVQALGDRGLIAKVLQPSRPDLTIGVMTRHALAYASTLADTLFALQCLGPMPMLLAGDPNHEKWLDGARTGALIAAFAMTEPEAGSDVARIRTTARRDGAWYRIDGRKWLISNAGIADFYVVFASTDPDAGRRGLSAFVVPAESPGLRFAGAQILSEPHPLGEIVFDGCRVPAANRIGAEGEGFKLGMATLDRLRPTVAAAACGMAQRALNEALEHAATRVQFGSRLAEFQLIQSMLATMATELEASLLLTYRAAWQFDGGNERPTKAIAMAKWYATEAAQRVIDSGVQILGGAGVLASSPVDQRYRAVRALRIYEGTSEVQQLIIAKTLISR